MVRAKVQMQARGEHSPKNIAVFVSVCLGFRKERDKEKHRATEMAQKMENQRNSQDR